MKTITAIILAIGLAFTVTIDVNQLPESIK